MNTMLSAIQNLITGAERFDAVALVDYPGRQAATGC
jgi:hypothetical protein